MLYVRGHRLKVKPVPGGVSRDGYSILAIGGTGWGKRTLRRCPANTAENPLRCWSCERELPPGTKAWRPFRDPPPERDLHRGAVLCCSCVEGNARV